MSLDDRYERLTKLGEGTYGVVYKGRDRKTNEFVALKKIKLEQDQPGIPATTVREISLLKRLKSPHIVQLLEWRIEDEDLYLVFEFADGDLSRYLKYKGHIHPYEVKLLMYQLIASIEVCHLNRIIHRDIKPQNILVSQNQLKLADFGLARDYQLQGKPYSNQVVTLWYRAPEILLGESHYSTPVDIWSIGCVFAELACSKTLFKGDWEIGQLIEIFQELGTPTEAKYPDLQLLSYWSDILPQFPPGGLQQKIGSTLDEAGMDLLLQMLEYDPYNRISATDALIHPYFNDLDKRQFTAMM